MNTLDWQKLENFIKERKPVEVSAGILNDWFWTAATVWENGEWKEREAAYVTSSWATPGFKATMENGDVIEVAAYRDQTPEEEAADKALRKKRREEMHAICEKIRDGRTPSAPNTEVSHPHPNKSS